MNKHDKLKKRLKHLLKSRVGSGGPSRVYPLPQLYGSQKKKKIIKVMYKKCRTALNNHVHK